MSIHKLYNLEQLEELSGGNNDFVKEIILVFLAEVPQQLEEIIKTYNKNDCENLYHKAHKLKPSIDLLGIDTIAKDIRLLENYANNEVNKSELPILIDNVQSVLNKVITDLKNDFGIK